MNYKKWTLLVCCIGLLLLAACKNNIVEASPAPLLEGSFNYTAYDSLGTIVAQGIIFFEIQDTTNIAGEWEISKVGDPQSIGPQIGEGRLIGKLSGETFWVALNPDVVDNNVFLQGESARNKYTGKWEWITEAGPTNWGIFTVEKIISIEKI